MPEVLYIVTEQGVWSQAGCFECDDLTVRGVTGGTLTVPVMANTAKVYGKEIALGAPALSDTEVRAGMIVGVQGVIAMAACRRR